MRPVAGRRCCARGHRRRPTLTAGPDPAATRPLDCFSRTSKSPTATQVLGVILFVLIEFLLIIIPFAFLELRPEATKAALKKTHGWLLGHARQLMAYTALVLGAYLTVTALVRLT